MKKILVDYEVGELDVSRTPAVEVIVFLQNMINAYGETVYVDLTTRKWEDTRYVAVMANREETDSEYNLRVGQYKET